MDQLVALFPPLPGARQIYDLDVDLALTSCGFGVPRFNYVGQRETLERWAAKKGPNGVREFWEKRNQLSIDDKPTYILADPDCR